MRKKIILSIFTSFLLAISFNVKAESTCSSERIMELTSLANNINADYEVYKTQEEDPLLKEGEYYNRNAFFVRVYNLTNDLNIRISVDGYKDKVAFYKDVNEDGILYIDSSYADRIKNYNLIIRSNDSNCQNEVIRQITVTVPMDNIFHNYSQCQNNPEYYLCAEFTTTDFSNIGDFDFVKQVTEYIEKKQKEEEWHSTITYKLLDFIRRNIVYIIVAIVIAIVIVFIIIRRNKQRRKLI